MQTAAICFVPAFPNRQATVCNLKWAEQGKGWHRVVPVWRWPACPGAGHIPPLLLLRVPGLRPGLGTVQVSGLKKPQQRLPLLPLSFHAEADFKVRLWPWSLIPPPLGTGGLSTWPWTCLVLGICLKIWTVADSACCHQTCSAFLAQVPLRTLTLLLAYPFRAASPSCTPSY